LESGAAVLRLALGCWSLPERPRNRSPPLETGIVDPGYRVGNREPPPPKGFTDTERWGRGAADPPPLKPKGGAWSGVPPPPLMELFLVPSKPCPPPRGGDGSSDPVAIPPSSPGMSITTIGRSEEPLRRGWVRPICITRHYHSFQRDNHMKSDGVGMMRGAMHARATRTKARRGARHVLVPGGGEGVGAPGRPRGAGCRHEIRDACVRMKRRSTLDSEED